MTPERIEEIKREYSEPMKWAGDPAVVLELLAALEEAQQMLEGGSYAIADVIAERDTYHMQLIEAQQTIARQREALEKIEEELTDDTTERAQQINAIIGAALGEGAES
ncbi:hypothetical protein [Paenibacillus rhizophilus]|uniref:Uncharacterized protein n=1 Tax=Paenibacillus rhizophilus TaxID=1850366 RepID=A0A3N9P2F5_9BACL|nr:hypothetical protein [Paenibacillus rhizophilus]RQW10401.1 hypothetical protein EH198_16425 [Paenibacillus rhizophilus]